MVMAAHHKVVSVDFTPLCAFHKLVWLAILSPKVTGSSYSTSSVGIISFLVTSAKVALELLKRYLFSVASEGLFFAMLSENGINSGLRC